MTILIPIRTVSALNAREHWRARSRRVKKEREATAWMLLLDKTAKPAMPCTVRMTRVGPSNGLDDDAIPGACKGVRDQIAEWLGINDRDPRVKWECAQRRAKEWGVEVEFIA